MNEFIGSPLGLTVVIATILASITLHEAMHAFAAHWLGDDTAQMQGRLTLNPIKHIDPFLTILMPLLLAVAGAPVLGAAKPVPFDPYRVKYEEFGAAIVAAAGPLTNFALALIGGIIFQLFAGALSEGVVLSLLTFVMVNLGFFVFNMIPFPPLDGSRVLYAFAPEPLQRVMAQIEAYGLVGFLLFFFVLFPYLSPIVGGAIDSLLQLLTGL